MADYFEKQITCLYGVENFSGTPGQLLMGAMWYPSPRRFARFEVRVFRRVPSVWEFRLEEIFL